MKRMRTFITTWLTKVRKTLGYGVKFCLAKPCELHPKMSIVQKIKDWSFRLQPQSLWFNCGGNLWCWWQKYWWSTEKSEERRGRGGRGGGLGANYPGPDAERRASAFGSKLFGFNSNNFTMMIGADWCNNEALLKAGIPNYLDQIDQILTFWQGIALTCCGCQHPTCNSYWSK